MTNEVKTGHDDSEISWGIKDGDYEYLGLVVGSGGGIIEFGTLSGRQPSSSDGDRLCIIANKLINTDIIMKSAQLNAATSVCYSDFHFHTFWISKVIEITSFTFDH